MINWLGSHTVVLSCYTATVFAAIFTLAKAFTAKALTARAPKTTAPAATALKARTLPTALTAQAH